MSRAAIDMAKPMPAKAWKIGILHGVRLPSTRLSKNPGARPNASSLHEYL